MRAGRLRHKVTLQRRTMVQDDYGALVNAWSDVAIRRCSIEPLMGREFYAKSGEHSRMPTRIRVRFDSVVRTLTPGDRIVDESQSPQIVYDIESVQNPRESDRELVLMCERNGS